jgi:hypothetical protein
VRAFTPPPEAEAAAAKAAAAAEDGAPPPPAHTLSGVMRLMQAGQSDQLPHTDPVDDSPILSPTDADRFGEPGGALGVAASGAASPAALASAPRPKPWERASTFVPPMPMP